MQRRVQLLELAAAEQRARIGPARLQHRVEHRDAGGACKLLQLVHRLLRLVARAGRDADEHRTVLTARRAQSRGTRDLLLERRDELLEVDVEIVKANGGERLPQRPLRRPVGRVDRDTTWARWTMPGRPSCSTPIAATRVEPQHRQVDEIVTRQRLAAQVRVDQAQAAQPPDAGALATEIGQRDLARIADHDVLDLSAPVDQHADLSADFRRALGESTSELGARHSVGRHASAIESLEGIELARRQAESVSVNHATPSQLG